MSENYLPYESILPVGGKGSRLATVEQITVAKPLVQVAGKELVTYSFDNLPPAIITHLILALGWHSDLVTSWFQDRETEYTVQFSRQPTPNFYENVVQASSLLQGDEFILCNSDEIREGFNLEAFIAFHRKSGRPATLLTTYEKNLHTHRLVSIDSRNGIVQTKKNSEQYASKPESEGLINAGLLLLSQRAFELTEVVAEGGWSCLLDPLCDRGALSAYIDTDLHYFNINTQQDLLAAEKKVSPVTL